MIQYLAATVSRQVKVTVITRPAADFKEKDQTTLHTTFDMLKGAGINVLFKSNIHQKFAVIDKKNSMVWKHKSFELWKCRGKHNTA